MCTDFSTSKASDPTWEPPRGPYDGFRIQKHQDASHKPAKLEGGPLWGCRELSFYLSYHLSCLAHTERNMCCTPILQPTKKNTASTGKCCGHAREQGRHDAKGAKPHSCQQGNVYLDFWVKRKEVLSSIISAQFVQLICFSSILGQRKALMLLPGHTEANIRYLERMGAKQNEYVSGSLCDIWDNAKLPSYIYQHHTVRVKWCGSAKWESREEEATELWIMQETAAT